MQLEVNGSIKFKHKNGSFTETEKKKKPMMNFKQNV